MYKREREREKRHKAAKGIPFLRAGDENCRSKRIEIPPTMVADAMEGVRGKSFVDRTMRKKRKGFERGNNYDTRFYSKFV